MQVTSRAHIDEAPSARETLLIEKDIKYSDHSALNTLQTCILRPSSTNGKRLWIIYIHGGAWRDPDIDAASFDTLQSVLLNNEVAIHLDGLASINYRLSSYPAHSTNPSKPDDPARDAKHPDHINDVCSAIAFLQNRYGFKESYMLVGHSCGATLAFQVAMARHRPAELNVILPKCIVGVEGIYDIQELLKTYRDIPAYRNFICNAFGDVPEVWQSVSPANADFTSSWSSGGRVMLIHSDADELLTSDQLDSMSTALSKQKWSQTGDKILTTAMLQELKHDEVWQQPEQLARMIIRVIEELS